MNKKSLPKSGTMRKTLTGRQASLVGMLLKRLCECENLAAWELTEDLEVEDWQVLADVRMLKRDGASIQSQGGK